MAASKLKQCLAHVLQMSGWYVYKHSQIMQHSALIIMYHRVLPGIDKSAVPVQAGMYVTPESLRLQLAYLKSKYDVISLQDLVTRLQAGRNISRCCVITFDDGWQDNYQYAFPLLRELNLPATIFLATGLIGTGKWFWPEELAWCITHACKITTLTLFPAALLDILNYDSRRHGDLEGRIDRIIEIVKEWDPLRREKLVECCTRCRQSVCKGESERLLLSWDEVREMNDSGLVSFGSHTVSHVLLDQMQGQELHYQLAESMEHLKREISDPVELLAYPNGNLSPGVVEMLPECGYRAAVTTARGFVHKTSSLLKLPRIAVHEDVSHTKALFQWRLFVR